MFIKSGYGVTGQGHGMPCPCENMASQRFDIERKYSIFIDKALPHGRIGRASSSDARYFFQVASSFAVQS